MGSPRARSAVIVTTFAVAFLLVSSLAADAATLTWVRQFGTPAIDEATDVAVTTNAVFAAGETQGAFPGFTYLGGEFDVYLAKYGVGGSPVWLQQFGTSSWEELTGLATDGAGGVYVTGWTQGTFPGQTSSGGGDAFLQKYDTNGTVKWTRQFGNGSDTRSLAIAAGSSGVYAVGWTSGALTGQPSAGGQDAWIRKYSAGGAVQWTRQFGTASGDYSYNVALDGAGVTVSGSTEGVLVGSSAGDTDVFVRRYDLNGAKLWTRQFGSAMGDDGLAIAADSSYLYVAGATGGTLPGQTALGGQDGFIRRYTHAGAQGWTKQFGTANDDYVLAAAADAEGIHLAGSTLGTFTGETSAGGEDAFARTYTAAGAHVDTLQFGTSATDGANDIAAAGGFRYAAGSTRGTFSNETAGGTYDAYIAKID